MCLGGGGGEKSLSPGVFPGINSYAYLAIQCESIALSTVAYTGT